MESVEIVKRRAREMRILIVVPTFNNSGTIASVVRSVQLYADDVLVVNDGSTDSTEEILSGISGIRIISYQQNKGKGYALKMAIRYAQDQGFRYAITMDADGQHFADDIVGFLDEIERTPDALLVGARNIEAENMPSKNTFANKFSNFWFRIETGQKMSDTQSGFRLYPVRRLTNMKFVTPRYEFEVEVLVRAVWRGIEVRNIPIKVYYPPQEERVSHFRPLRDFTRISILNTFLVLGAFLFYYPWKFARSLTRENVRKFIRNNITHSSESNARVAAAMGLGVFFGIVPLWGYQMLTAGVTAHFMRLNKVLTVISSNISIPPMIPIILYGSYKTGGILMGRAQSISLSDMSFDRIGGDMVQYLVGSLVLAVVCGLAVWFLSYIILTVFKRKPVYE